MPNDRHAKGDLFLRFDRHAECGEAPKVMGPIPIGHMYRSSGVFNIGPVGPCPSPFGKIGNSKAYL